MQNPVSLHLDDAQLAALGDYAANWAYLETELEFTISAMSHLAFGTQAMPFPFADRMKHWAKAITKVTKSTNAVRRYKSIIVLATKAHDNRTKFLHGRALGDPQKKTRRICIEHHRHRHGHWTAIPISIKPQTIRKMARYVGRVSATLISLNRRYLPIAPYALPNTYPTQSADGRTQIRRGHTGSSTKKTRPQRLAALELQRKEL